jgi:hypothetical protein
MLIVYVFLFGVVRLAWSDSVMNPTKEQRQMLCKSREKRDGDPGSD